jgi:hypothetical protein
MCLLTKYYSKGWKEYTYNLNLLLTKSHGSYREQNKNMLVVFYLEESILLGHFLKRLKQIMKSNVYYSRQQHIIIIIIIIIIY